MSFRARYEGVCADCDEPIQVGQLIRTEGDEYVYVRCAPARELGEVCPSCWLEKSVTGACGCEEP